VEQYEVTNKYGLSVVKGDTIEDFRGTVWRFLKVTRGTEYNGTAKVLVEGETELNYYGDGPYQREFYAHVFDLTVVTRETDPTDYYESDDGPIEDETEPCQYAGWDYRQWEEAYEELLDEVYGTVEVAGMTFDTGRALRELDPIAFRMSVLDYQNSTLEDCDCDEH
jgi:hypothetical protein